MKNRVSFPSTDGIHFIEHTFYYSSSRSNNSAAIHTSLIYNKLKIYELPVQYDLMDYVYVVCNKCIAVFRQDILKIHLAIHYIYSLFIHLDHRRWH